MIRPINRDEGFLRQPSLPATAEDLPALDDLTETLLAHSKACVGMAANMIGVNRRMIVFFDNGRPVEMLNPVILKSEGPYEAEEGCLSLIGTRRVRRHRSVKVQWQNRDFKPRIKTFSGFTAQIIQHEIDHLFGIIV